MRKTLVTPLTNRQTVAQVHRDEHISKKKKPFTLPWWFIFVAYGLSALVVCVSGFFIWARGVEFGDTKTRKWLTSSITGFFSSIIVTQPVKVIQKIAFLMCEKMYFVLIGCLYGNIFRVDYST